MRSHIRKLHAWDRQCQSMASADMMLCTIVGLFFLVAAITGAGFITLPMGVFMLMEAARIPGEMKRRANRMRKRKSNKRIV